MTTKKSPQPNANHLHLAYLQQISELLEDKHLSQAARLGYIAKQICEKHVIHIKGQDSPKLRRCKACQAPIKCDSLFVDKQRNRHKRMQKERQKKLVKQCPLCNHVLRYSLEGRPSVKDDPEEEERGK